MYPRAMTRIAKGFGHRLPRTWEVLPPPDSFCLFNDVRGSVPAGPLAPGEEGDLGRLVMDLGPIGIPTTSRTFLLRVEGDSMSGAGIQDGDFVILEKRAARPGDIVSALLETEVTLKRYVVEAGRPVLRAENPKYADIPLPDGFEAQGVVVGLIRRM